MLKDNYAISDYGGDSEGHAHHVLTAVVNLNDGSK